MAKASAALAWQQALIAMSAAVIGVVVIGLLYWAQVVFIPLALGIFLTFILAPLTRGLERRGLGRVPSVVLVVVVAGLLLIGLLGMVTKQVAGLVADLPTYTENITGKVRQLRELGGDSQLSRRFSWMQEKISQELKSDPEDDEKAAEPPRPAEAAPAPATENLTKMPAWLAGLLAVVAQAAGSLGAVGLAVLLAIFMLLNREDLRNRFIRVVGQQRMAGTTKAVDDAGERISRYLLMQLIVNGTYGLAWGIGLYLIGVDHALLWGFLAAVLRYVPYIGAPIAALLPIALSVVQFPSWWPPLVVIGFLLVLELVSNNIMEPWLYGMSIGVSVVATVIAAVFWGFLWGPIGLVLSSPLTVCLVVLGKYVPQLEFFDVLLGDEPALDDDISYYQRLLARDQDEAAQLVDKHVKAGPAEEVYDDLLIPSLNYTRRDRQRDELTDDDEDFVHRVTQEVLDDLGAKPDGDSQPAEPLPPREGADAPVKVRVLACAAQDEADRLALLMLQQLLGPDKWELEVAAVETLASELIAQAAQQRPAVICIASLPPGGLAQARYLCKRLRAPLPEIKILVARFGLRGNLDSNREQLLEAGADLMATTLLEARDQLVAWLPALSSEPRAAAG